MRLLISLLLPWLQFILMLRPFSAIICLALQLSILGWPLATVWAIRAYREYRIDRMVRAQMGLR